MKERLDVLLVKRNLADSREKAKAIIMSGNVFVEGQREDKAGTTFPEEVNIEVRGHVLPYVSRGGLKLEKAMKEFRCDSRWKGLYRCWIFHWRIYRLYASEWSKESICHRCGKRTAGLEAASGSESGMYGEDEYPLCDSGRSWRTC